MNKQIKAKYLIIMLTVFLLTNSIVFSANMSPQEIKELIIRADNNSAPNQMESYTVMKNYKPGRDVVQNRMHAYRKGDKMVAVFLSPASQKGQAFIRGGDNMWMYLPKSEKVIRIGAKETSMGGEASNADILRGSLSEDYDGVYLGDETIDGVACYKLELKGKRRTVAYDKVVYWISREKELPVKREYYTISGKKVKTMYCKELKVLGGKERPSVFIIENEENKAYRTEMITEEINPDVTLGDHIFNPQYAKNLR